MRHARNCQKPASAVSSASPSTHGRKRAANQVLYNLQNREIEFDLLPRSQTNKIPIMAYSPVGHSDKLLRNEALKKIAQSHDATPAQIALAWVLRQSDVIVIPKASTEAHVRDNAASLKIKFDERRFDRSQPRIFSTEIKEVIADALTGAPHAAKVSRSVNVSIPVWKSDSQAGEHRGIFSNERGQLRMRGFEFFNGLF